MYCLKKVSVVIAAYNSEQFIGECLDSLISQTYKNLEIICVNDGSTDGTLSVLEKYKDIDSRIIVFTKANEGKGAASARNMGLDYASGEYVFVLDSDDFFEADMIEGCVAVAEKNSSEVVVYGADMYDNNLKKIVKSYGSIKLDWAPKKEWFTYEDCTEVIYQISELVAWNKMYKRSLIEDNKLRFDPIPISDDQFVPVIAMVTAKRISVIGKNYLHYRFNSGHSQVDNQPRFPEAAYAANYNIVSKLKDLGVFDEIKKSYINMAMRIMREYFDNMREYGTIKFLYEKYKNDIFPLLKAEKLSEDYFYDKRLGQWYELIRDKSLGEILFSSVRGYGEKRTTGILRFQVPYEKIKHNSKIVLLGKGIVGKYWYAQLILSEYCDVVCWTDKKETIPENIRYDEILDSNI